MQKKELDELKRTLKSKFTTINKICGCYVHGETAKIIAKFEDKPYNLMENEIDEFVARFKKAQSGKFGKTIFEVEYSTSEVASGKHHQVLRKLRDSKLEDQDALDWFFSTVSKDFAIPSNFVLMLASVSYNVPKKGVSVDTESETEDSGSVFDYLICVICPVAQEKVALSYFESTQNFRLRNGEWLAKAPFCGFTFPAFTDRAADLYHAIYYTKTGLVDEFVPVALGANPPISEDEQMQAFTEAFRELGNDADFNVLQCIRGDVEARKKAHEDDNATEPFTVSIDDVKESLAAYGIDEKKVESFSQTLADTMGDSDLSSLSVLNTDTCVIKTPDKSLSIKKAKESGSEFRVEDINGTKYLMIPITDGIVVNGIELGMDRDETESKNSESEFEQMTLDES